MEAYTDSFAMSFSISFLKRPLNMSLVVMVRPFSLFLLHNHFITEKNLKKNPAM